MRELLVAFADGRMSGFVRVPSIPMLRAPLGFWARLLVRASGLFEGRRTGFARESVALF